MAFCAAIRRESVSLLRFQFCSHVQVFLCEISLICLFKYPYGCFPSHFCFLIIVDLLVFIVTPGTDRCNLSFFAVFLCSLRVVLIHQLYLQFCHVFLTLSSLDICCLFMSSLECRALCIIISFLVLWFIC